MSSFLFRNKASKVGTAIIFAFIVLIVLGPFLSPYGPNDTSSLKHNPPSFAHPFGTDWLGHDVLTQVIYGAYPSLLVGVVVAVGAIVLGVIVGVLAGYYRKSEAFLIGSADVVLTFPPLPLMILLGTLYPATTVLIVGILIVVLWPVSARAIRSQVLSLKERPYVESSKTNGMTNFQVITKIMIPEISSLAVAYFVLTVAAAIVLVTALQFLGVGNPNEVSWGSILYWGQQFAFYNGDWWWIVAPGAAITLAAMAFALLGFSIEEVMNPRLRE
ncbi:MAG: ABC transporter permease [Thaumarchaeota archaeon]|nr:ABC transporter permease [Nitrososphaerota archaeon]